MKLRIQGNTIRIRLGKTETSTLASGKSISQTTRFSALTHLTTAIETSNNAIAPTTTFHASHIGILLPRAETIRWAESSEVAIQAVQPIDAEQSLSILIEKDFECLHDQRQDEPDTFHNPLRVPAL